MVERTLKQIRAAMNHIDLSSRGAIEEYIRVTESERIALRSFLERAMAQAEEELK